MTSVAYRPPLILSYQELCAVLGPITVGYRWGENTIRDLWKIGAPVPQPLGQPERRVIFPNQLRTWLTDVLAGKGQDPGAELAVYQHLRGSYGHR